MNELNEPNELNKATVDLLRLVSEDTQLRRVATTEGGEWAGPCPLCRAGRDRFRVQPARQRWFCRRCTPPWEDAISYVRKRSDSTYAAACQELLQYASEPRSQGATGESAERIRKEWSLRAVRVAQQCEAQLWAPTGEPGRRLLAQRGITNRTAAYWRLGYQPADGRVEGVWVPAGLTLPWFVGGVVEAIRIRRASAGAERRYTSVGGSRFVAPFGVWSVRDHDAVVLAEGELDAALLWQEAGDLVGVVTFGSASYPLTGPRVAPL